MTQGTRAVIDAGTGPVLADCRCSKGPRRGKREVTDAVAPHEADAHHEEDEFKVCFSDS
jgi:hypothetical protein